MTFYEPSKSYMSLLLLFKRVGRVFVFFFCHRSCYLFVHCWRTPTPMILSCRRLLTCTRQTGASMRALQGAGPRSMLWVNVMPCPFVGRRVPFLSFYKMSFVFLSVLMNVYHLIWLEGKVLNPALIKKTSFFLYIHVLHANVWRFAV